MFGMRDVVRYELFGMNILTTARGHTCFDNEYHSSEAVVYFESESSIIHHAMPDSGSQRAIGTQ